MKNIQEKIVSMLSAWVKEQAGITITYIDTSDDFRIIEFEDVYQAMDQDVIDLCRYNLKKAIADNFGWECTSDFCNPFIGFTMTEVKMIFSLTEEQVNTLIGYCSIVGGSNDNIA